MVHLFRVSGVSVLACVAALAASGPAHASSLDEAIAWHEAVNAQAASLEQRAERYNSTVTTVTEVTSSGSKSWTQQMSASGAFRVKGTNRPAKEPAQAWELVCTDQSGKQCWKRTSSAPKWVKYTINAKFPYSTSELLYAVKPGSTDAKYRASASTFTASGPVRGEYARVVFSPTSMHATAYKAGKLTTVRVQLSTKGVTVKMPRTGR